MSETVVDLTLLSGGLQGIEREVRLLRVQLDQLAGTVPARLSSIDARLAELEAAIAAFLDQHNANPKAFRWIKSADDILAAIERFCVHRLT